MKWLIKEYMTSQHIESVEELASRSGINVQTLRRRIEAPSQLRMFEVVALNQILHFKNEDLLKIMRGETE